MCATWGLCWDYHDTVLVDEIVVSFNVASLFTCIPRGRWHCGSVNPPGWYLLTCTGKVYWLVRTQYCNGITGICSDQCWRQSPCHFFFSLLFSGSATYVTDTCTALPREMVKLATETAFMVKEAWMKGCCLFVSKDAAVLRLRCNCPHIGVSRETTSQQPIHLLHITPLGCTQVGGSEDLHDWATHTHPHVSSKWRKRRRL